MHLVVGRLFIALSAVGEAAPLSALPGSYVVVRIQQHVTSTSNCDQHSVLYADKTWYSTAA